MVPCEKADARLAKYMERANELAQSIGLEDAQDLLNAATNDNEEAKALVAELNAEKF